MIEQPLLFSNFARDSHSSELVPLSRLSTPHPREGHGEKAFFVVI